MQVKDIDRYLGDPEALEALYRREPLAFEDALLGLPQDRRDHLLARAWRARLRRVDAVAASVAGWGWVALYALIAGLGWRLLAIPDDFDLFARSAAFAAIVPLALLLGSPRASWGRLHLALGAAALACLALLQLLPMEKSDSGTLAAIHAPLLLWCLAGAWIAGADWRGVDARNRYVLRSGEIAVFTGAILLGGILLTALTIAMFDAIGFDIGKWYTENVVVVGMGAAPVVAAGLGRSREARGEPLAPQLARIFSPLALATLVAYAVAMVSTGRSPHLDRDALIVLNAMLAGAAALVALSSLPQGQEGRAGMALVHAGMSWIAVCVDVFALFAIVYRTLEGGWTPNRVAVLGENLLLLVFLVGVAWHLTAFLRGRSDPERLRVFVASMLPVFALWTAFVVWLLPPLFRFA